MSELLIILGGWLLPKDEIVLLITILFWGISKLEARKRFNKCWMCCSFLSLIRFDTNCIAMPVVPIPSRFFQCWWEKFNRKHYLAKNICLCILQFSFPWEWIHVPILHMIRKQSKMLTFFSLSFTAYSSLLLLLELSGKILYGEGWLSCRLSNGLEGIWCNVMTASCL